MFCSNYGAEAASEANFCVRCGQGNTLPFPYIAVKFVNLIIRLLNHRYKAVRSISAENKVGLSCKDWTMDGTVTFPRLFMNLVQETRCVISVFALEIKLNTKRWNTFFI